MLNPRFNISSDKTKVVKYHIHVAVCQYQGPYMFNTNKCSDCLFYDIIVNLELKMNTKTKILS